MKLKFNVTGMTCAACSARIEKVLSKMDGVESAAVNLATETAIVVHSENVADADLVSRIEKIGFSAKILKKFDEEKNEQEKLGQGVGFERIRRITGYLVGTMDKWNDAKRAEERDRVKHGLNNNA